jgi:hypothetical protein
MVRWALFLPLLLGLVIAGCSGEAVGPAPNSTTIAQSVEVAEPVPTPTPTPPELAVRDALKRQAWGPSGIGEVVPGFGGIFLDPNDNSIAYVYMVDPSQRDLAKEAARIMLGHQRFEQQIREVRVVKADYSISQLNEWYGRMWNVVHTVEGVSWTDLNEGKNRIAIGMIARLGARQEMEALLTSLGIPLEAVIIQVGCADTGQPYKAPPPQPDDPTLRSLKVWVEAPSEVRVEQPVRFTLKVKNVSDRVLNVDYGEPPRPDFVVTRPDGAKVWSAECDRGIHVGVGKTLTLQPGEELSFNTLWHLWDGQGEPVVSGTYLVYGVFDTYPKVLSDPVAFTIRP